MKMILSVAGVLALTMSAWALEAGMGTSSNSVESKSLLMRISDLNQDCELHDHDSVTAEKRGGGIGEKNTARGKTGRDPLPAERLGLMLKLSSL